jgi:hypothetical protein
VAGGGACTVVDGVDDLRTGPCLGETCSGSSDATSDDGVAVASDAPVGDALAADSGPLDSSLLQDVAADVVDACSASGCFGMPPGFSLIAFGATAKGSACPGGFGEPTDTVEGPNVAAGACTCGCSVTTPPTCPTNGSIGNWADTNGSQTCGMSVIAYANVGCGTEGIAGAFGPGDDHRFQPPGPTGGACSAPVNQDATRMSYAALGRVCQATTLPECNGMVCAPALAAPFAACIASDGDVACPTLFPTKHLLGTAASFTCSPGCTCSVSATCTGTLDYYSSTDCSGSVIFQIVADDACHATDYGAYSSHEYVPNAPSGVACVGGGSTSASAPALTGTTTVCCG